MKKEPGYNIYCKQNKRISAMLIFIVKPFLESVCCGKLFEKFESLLYWQAQRLRCCFEWNQMDRSIALVIFGALCCAVNIKINCDQGHSSELLRNFSDGLRIHKCLPGFVNYEEILMYWKQKFRVWPRRLLQTNLLEKPI